MTRNGRRSRKREGTISNASTWSLRCVGREITRQAAKRKDTCLLCYQVLYQQAPELGSFIHYSKSYGIAFTNLDYCWAYNMTDSQRSMPRGSVFNSCVLSMYVEEGHKRILNKPYGIPINKFEIGLLVSFIIYAPDFNSCNLSNDPPPPFLLSFLFWFCQIKHYPLTFATPLLGSTVFLVHWCCPL
jgi:hypothetical protein